MKKPLALLFFVFLFHSAFAQKAAITGKVIDGEDNMGLIGVTIVVEGTTNGTMTDIEGNYSIQASPSDKLVFSFIGYTTTTIEVGNQTTIDVTLDLDVEQLEEVVVVGYGSMKKTEVLGSVASIKTEDITKVQNSNFVEGMQGRAAGLRVGSSSGVPGAPANIRIRGDNSINTNTSPLWIIDGVPVYSGGGFENDTGGAVRQDPMSLINPNDIESIEVLKDAAATAIYGSRGSNGVILVTTKSGKKGKSTTNLSVNTGITELSRSPEDVGFVNTAEWFDLVETGLANSGQASTEFLPTPVLGTFRDNPVRFLTRNEAMLINTNWFDQLLQTGYFQEYNISNTQGSEKLRSFFSLNYREDESVLIGNNLRRFTGRANIDFNITDDIVLGTKLTYANTENNRVSSGAGSGGGGFGQANREALPWFPIYDPSHPSGYWNPRSRMNLTAANDPDLFRDVVKQYRGVGLLFGEFNVPWVKGLKLRSEFSFDYIQNNGLSWTSELLRVNEDDGNRARDRAVTSNRINYNAYLNYNRTFGEDHSVTAALGTESQRNQVFRRDINAINVSGAFQELTFPATIVSASSRQIGENYLRAYFSRANYTYKGKYQFGLSMRYDGVSRFLPDNRWAFFPAVSAGWIISDETFMASTQNIVNFLKLRGSFGITGNQNVSGNAFVTTYNNNAGTRYGELDDIAGGTNVSRLGNPSITWETTESLDLGVDFGLLNNRISGYFAYYHQTVSDLLLRSAIPESSGPNQKSIWENIGEIENFGVELELSTIIIDKDKLDWNFNINLTTNQTEVISLSPELDATGAPVILVDGRGRDTQQRALTGSENKIWYMAMDAGVDPERGVNTIWELDQEHFDATGETITTGRKIPATSNNLENNRFYHEGKSVNPNFFGGFGTDVRYGNWDLSLQFVFEQGRYFYDYNMQRTTEVQRGQAVLRKDLIGNTWTPENPNAKYPMLAWNGIYPWDWDTEAEVITEDGRVLKGDWIQRDGNYKNEPLNWSKYLFKGDFMRLRSLQVGYTIPEDLLKRVKLSYARLTLTGNNLFTLTGYDSWDPETGGGTIPPLRTYVFGLNVRF